MLTHKMKHLSCLEENCICLINIFKPITFYEKKNSISCYPLLHFH